MSAVDQALASGIKAAATEASAKPIISFRNISKRWGTTVGVDNVSLDILPGEFFALLGPSGCGKTTLLRVLAGLEVPTEGHIMIDGQDMAEIPPNRRAVNMVFQSYAVFPHMSVADNVAYGLKVDGVPQSERDRRSSAPGVRIPHQNRSWPSTSKTRAVGTPASTSATWRGAKGYGSVGRMTTSGSKAPTCSRVTSGYRSAVPDTELRHPSTDRSDEP